MLALIKRTLAVALARHHESLLVDKQNSNNTYIFSFTARCTRRYATEILSVSLSVCLSVTLHVALGCRASHVGDELPRDEKSSSVALRVIMRLAVDMDIMCGYETWAMLWIYPWICDIGI